ncbi:MAG: hypothetical protein WC760_05025 [Bacteroidia bacterium]|jgi:uncharacterized membrane protein
MNLLICGFAAYVFQLAVTYKLPPNDKVFIIIQKNLKKTIFSVAIYITSLIGAFFYPLLSLILIILVAIVWVIPDRSIERLLDEE